MCLSEFAGWKEYYVREPFGAFVDNWRTANMTAHLMNAALRVTPTNALKTEDFIPKITQ
jgi:hypothetical protein